MQNKQESVEMIHLHHHQNLIVESPSNVYTLINENLVVSKDIRIRHRVASRDEIQLTGWQFSLPAPLLADGSEHSGVAFSSEGQRFPYTIDHEGKVSLEGTLKDSDDELIFNFSPYLAELPLRYQLFRIRRDGR